MLPDGTADTPLRAGEGGSSHAIRFGLNSKYPPKKIDFRPHFSPVEKAETLIDVIRYVSNTTSKSQRDEKSGVIQTIGFQRAAAGSGVLPG